MQIHFLPPKFNVYKNKQNSTTNSNYPNLAQLKHDTVSFGAMKKAQFDGVNRMIVEKFKAPIEKFNTQSDFQSWAGKMTENLMSKNFGGRQAETIEQRKHMLKEWKDYVLTENGVYTSAIGLLILSAITNDLKPDNDKIPPVLNKGVLADCVSEISKNSEENKDYQPNFRKMYETKLRAQYFNDETSVNGNTGWVVIPSKINDPENFEANVEKLKTLSHENWCTKSLNAEPYLSDGDFHVYLENGKPKLGVRFIGDEIQEIQGELNNGKIPLAYFDEAQKHIDENGLKLKEDAKDEIKNAKEVKAQIEQAKLDLRTAIETNDAKTILEYFNFEVEDIDENGLLTISKYWQPDGFTYADCGIDENKLFEKVKKISRNAEFRGSKVTNLGNLQSIGGDALFTHSPITNLGKLQLIGGVADLHLSLITDLGNLQSIGGDAWFNSSKLTNLGNLQSIGGNAWFTHSPITDLGNLQSIGGNAWFNSSKLTNFGNLQSIGGDAWFTNSPITDLGNLQSIGGNVYLKNSQIKDVSHIDLKGEVIW